MTTPPNRRDVPKLGAGSLALAALQPSPGAAAADAPASSSPGSRRPLKKAVMWGMIRPGNSVREKFQILKDAGYDGVEMDSPNGPPNDEIKEACKATGIQIEGIVDSVHWRQTLSHNSESVREAGLEALKTALRDCKQLGGT